MNFKVPFFDLRAGFLTDQKAMETAVMTVLQSGQWIGGPAVDSFEKSWAQFSGARYTVGVANGTDAITLALWAAGVKQGDEVILPAFSAYPSAVGVMRSGAVPVFVDVKAEDGLIDAALVRKAVTAKTKAIMPVHLYGNSCDMVALQKVTEEFKIPLVEDCAQAHGVRFSEKPAGSFSAAAAWSFYPTKNLGAAGDAGAVTTDSEVLYEKLRRLRNYGQKDRYFHIEMGVNSRLDPIQAALLSARVTSLIARNERRRTLGARYDLAISNIPSLRAIASKNATVSNRHLYPVFSKSLEARDALKSALADGGVETLVHYPVPMPDQTATPEASRSGDFSNSRRLAETELSLPIYPEMSDAQQNLVIDTLIESTKRSAT